MYELTVAKPDEIDLLGQLILGKRQLWLLGKENICFVKNLLGVKKTLSGGGVKIHIWPLKTGPFTPQKNFLTFFIFFF